MSLTDSHVVDSMTSSTEHHQVRAWFVGSSRIRRVLRLQLSGINPGVKDFDGPSVGEGHGVEPCDHECEDRR